MAATPAKEIICPMCGFKNQANAARCVSCGAKLDVLAMTPDYSDEELAARAHQQDTFEWKWVGISVGVYLALQFVVLVVGPMAISTFDPQGMPGIFLSAGIWFLGGIVMGVISPGKTFMEPAVGALIACPFTIGYLMYVTPEGFNPSLIAYIIGGLLGVMISLFGAFFGEFLQRKRDAGAPPAQAVPAKAAASGGGKKKK